MKIKPLLNNYLCKIIKSRTVKTVKLIFLLSYFWTVSLSAASNKLQPALASPMSSQQVKQKIIGLVQDEKGEPVIGATVKESSTGNGTMTDVNGKFSINATPGNTLIISYIGYKTETIIVKRGVNSYNISLLEDSKSLNEVVIIGYGTQKKVNMTGSVSSVNAKQLEGRAATNISGMIQGKVSGLQIVTNSAQPGRDEGSLLVRGRGSFSTNSSPLVIINGVVGSLSDLSPDEVETISVLKDAASAAIYGSRAANGVILVTTKSGKKGAVQISYNGTVGWQRATRLGEQIWNSAEYMTMYNKMADRMGGYTKYSESLIAKYTDPNRDKNLYPDYNWMKETWKTGFVSTHSLGVSGGSDKITYSVSLGYLTQTGLLDCHNYDRYTGLVNLEAQVHKNIKVGTVIDFCYGDIREPKYTNTDLVHMIAQSRPMAKPYLPDGSGRYTYMPFPTTYGGEWENRNPVWAMHDTSRKEQDWKANAQIYTLVDFIKTDKIKLNWMNKGAFRYYDTFSKMHYPAHPEGYYYLKESEYQAGGKDEYVYGCDFFPEKGVSDYDTRTFYKLFYSTLNFSWDINADHSLSAMIGYQQENQSYRYLYGYRDTFPSDAITELDGGSSTGQSLSGDLYEYALRSYFGRFNYAFKGKYLFEANFRYDGTSRISSENRWGIFPSFSGAWRVTEEKFMKNLRWLDNLKLRASWGKLGNSEIGYYPYQAVYSTTAYIFDGSAQTGVVQNSLTDKSLKWETTTVTNLGIDFSIANGLFSATIDWYNKITDGILSQASIPGSMGMNPPTINYGKMRNRGFELELGHHNKIKDFSYGLNFTASFNRNKVLKLRAPSYGSYIYEEGKPYGEHYLYVWDGIYQSQSDIDNSPAQPYNPKPGDIKFRDIKQDNKIDSNDRTMVKGVYPKMLYSFSLNASYKDFDLSVYFQGVDGRKIWTDFVGFSPFNQGSSPNVKFRNAWTPENTNTNVPALYHSGYAAMEGLRSTYNLKDASYLRLKNLQLGYNVPKTFIRKFGIQSLRVYFSGENLLTFTDYPDYDPERNGDGWHAAYPQAKTYSFGLNVKF